MNRPIVALTLLLAATAVAAVTPPPMPTDSSMHGFVFARYAFADDQLAAAAAFYDQAHRRDPGDIGLMRRSFDLAVAAGDAKTSYALAAQLAAAGQGEANVVLLRIADALSRSDWPAADGLRVGLTEAGYAQVVSPIVGAWTLYGRGQTDAAIAALDPAKFAGITRSYVSEQRAHMLAAAKRWDEAADAYHALAIGTGSGINWMRVGEADALQQAGKTAQAADVLASNPGDLPLAAAKARFDAGKRIGALAPSPAAGVAWMSARIASDLSREKPVPLSLAFARVATFLSPDLDAAWLITGDILARNGQNAAALAAYDHVPANDPMAPLVVARRVTALEAMDDRKAAGALLQAAVAAPSATAQDWVRLGDWYRRGDDYTAAVSAYDRALTLAQNSGAHSKTSASEASLWPLYFLRGSAREQAHDWAGAEPDLRNALAMAPDDATVLNYLGYAMLDRGINLPEAQALIERAAAMKPDDGFIQDSLGWAYFRTGQFDKAVPALERAVAAEPGDPTINEHLGDAYWRTGRPIEARFRWRATLDLDPTPKQKALVAKKLDYGLDVATTFAATTSAPAAPPAK
jgi:tetratricopeptide (TPR) repeat protein